MDIDSLGTETIRGLLDHGLIKNYADLFSLTYEQLNGLEFKTYSEKKGDFSLRSLREKSAQNIIRAIEISKSVPFERVLFGLGIRFVGQTVAEKLAEHFETIDKIAEASLETLIEVPEIGERIAQSVVRFFDTPESIRQIDKLKAAGLNFEIIKKVVISEGSNLADKSFVISGVFTQFSRDELKEKIKAKRR